MTQKQSSPHRVVLIRHLLFIMGGPAQWLRPSLLQRRLCSQSSWSTDLGMARAPRTSMLARIALLPLPDAEQLSASTRKIRLALGTN